MSLKQYLQRNNIPVAKAAKELNVSRQHIYDMTGGCAYPSRKLAIRIEEWSRGELTKERLLFGDNAQM